MPRNIKKVGYENLKEKGNKIHINVCNKLNFCVKGKERKKKYFPPRRF